MYRGRTKPQTIPERRQGGEVVDKNQIDEFELALFEFVKRASKEGATAEEVEALPAVARVLKELIFGY